MQLFFAEKLDSQHGQLDLAESKHCLKVLRHEIGAVIDCVDGQGNKYRGRITGLRQDQVQLQWEETLNQWGEHAGHIRLLVSPLRLKDRFEWLIEKSVELGVNEIIPVQCHRTDPYKSKFKVARIEGLMRSALKQSKRSQLPSLSPTLSLAEALLKVRNGLGFIAWCEAQAPLQNYATDIQSSSSLSLLIGPEGDFTEAEIAQAQSQGFIPISLGANRLRSETAVLYGLSLFKQIWGY